MLNPDALSQYLEQKSDGHLAKKRGKQLQPFRGLRGTPPADIVHLLANLWKHERPQLPRDMEALHDLFVSAHEDGLVAIGIVAALLPDAPADALDLADRWTILVDDVETADSLGWLVLGPGLLASGEPFADTLLEHTKSIHCDHVRRMAVMACMAALPVPIEGPAAAALRERTGEKRTAFVTEPLPDAFLPVVDGFLRDSSSLVQKAIARVLRSWATLDPDAAEAYIDAVSGGVSKKLRQEVTRGATKGRRQQEAMARYANMADPDDLDDPDGLR